MLHFLLFLLDVSPDDPKGHSNSFEAGAQRLEPRRRAWSRSIWPTTPAKWENVMQVFKIVQESKIQERSFGKQKRVEWPSTNLIILCFHEQTVDFRVQQVSVSIPHLVDFSIFQHPSPQPLALYRWAPLHCPDTFDRAAIPQGCLTRNDVLCLKMGDTPQL